MKHQSSKLVFASATLALAFATQLTSATFVQLELQPGDLSRGRAIRQKCSGSRTDPGIWRIYTDGAGRSLRVSKKRRFVDSAS